LANCKLGSRGEVPNVSVRPPNPKSFAAPCCQPEAPRFEAPRGDESAQRSGGPVGSMPRDCLQALRARRDPAPTHRTLVAALAQRRCRRPGDKPTSDSSPMLDVDYRFRTVRPC
jgi:hypothetical protein